MRPVPASVADFLQCRRIAVAGASRQGNMPANAILRRLRESGHDAIPVNPLSDEIDGQRCYRDLGAVPDPLDAVMVVTPPAASVAVARAALGRGIRHIWFHRSFGDGSVSPEALALCRSQGVEPIEGGCPLMYCAPVDPAHRAFRWWLRLSRRIPG